MVISLIPVCRIQVYASATKWSAGPCLSLNIRPRAGLNLERQFKEKTRLGLYVLSPQLTMMNLENYEEWEFGLSYYRMLYAAGGLMLSAGPDCAMLTHDPEEEKIAMTSGTVTDILLRLSVKGTLKFSRKWSVSDKIGLEYSSGRSIMPFYAFYLDFSWGKDK